MEFKYIWKIYWWLYKYSPHLYTTNIMQSIHVYVQITTNVECIINYNLFTRCCIISWHWIFYIHSASEFQFQWKILSNIKKLSFLDNKLHVYLVFKYLVFSIELPEQMLCYFFLIALIFNLNVHILFSLSFHSTAKWRRPYLDPTSWSLWLWHLSYVLYSPCHKTYN